MALVATLQDNIRKCDNTEITNYAYWLGGTDTTNAALAQYDLLRTGYGRLFILRMPAFVEFLLEDETRVFKHMLEFGNVGISGIQGYTAEFASLTAGYVGNTVEIPTGVKDDTNSISIRIYETQGSLIRTYIDFWLTGTSDPYTGLSHYHGARDVDANSSSYVLSQANHTMEALYVATDPTGEQAEYVCLLTNMFPRSSDHSHFEYEPGSHDLVQLTLEFTCTKYMSAQINYIGTVALNKFAILKNYLNMYSGYTASKVEEIVGDHNITNWTNPETGTDLTGTYMSKEYLNDLMYQA
mgnify:FL=1